jgi:hypothetical protein
MTNRYILNADGKPVPEPDLMKWARWFETANRRVNRTDPAKDLDELGPACVSTVFLGIDHNLDGQGPPVLWETKVFGGPLNQEADRCSGSREQAEAMHARMVERVRQSQAKDQNP